MQLGPVYSLETLTLAGSALSGAFPVGLADRAGLEYSLAIKQERVLAGMGTDERLAQLACE